MPFCYFHHQNYDDSLLTLTKEKVHTSTRDIPFLEKFQRKPFWVESETPFLELNFNWLNCRGNP